MIVTRDISALMNAQIHLNLCVGTVGAYAQNRPDLDALLEELMSFKKCASFLITEFGHGLDAKNIETQATLLPDGSFDLHSPNQNAAKTMPPTTPLAGMERIAIVLAKLIINGEDRGPKLFVAPLCGPTKMHPGVTSWMLPVRPGTKPLDHAITSFNHVRLPSDALLGSAAKSMDPQLDLHNQLWRISVGAIAMSLINISCLQVGCYIAAQYSKRRYVEKSAHAGLVPIISFSTQYRPILQGLVAGEVLQLFSYWSTDMFQNIENSLYVRRGVAVTFKATAIHFFEILSEVAERCGWRGFYGHNQIAELHLSFSGNAVGEGDVHVLCLRTLKFHQFAAIPEVY